ncbi:MAG TPA: GMC family oxidoreductase [Methylocystis sp.]|nr:GMC family oxidoreductase [Methylocystis sp.]
MAVPAHGRQYYRMGADDLSPCDGLSPAWPLRPEELAPWYAMVERRLGLAGACDNLACLPNSEISHVLRPTVTEERLKRAIAQRWPGAHAVLGRYGRPFNLLTDAARTGRLLIREGAIAREIEVDGSGQVRGVICIDHRSREEFCVRSQLVFLCASALESTRLLLLSRSPRHAGGLGAASGVLGRYLMDHVMLIAEGKGPRASQRLPTEDQRCLYLPRFDARETATLSAGRGFGVQVYQWPTGDNRSHLSATSFAEMLPRPENRVTLHPSRRDAWGIPVLRIDCAFGAWERGRAQEQVVALRELAEAVGVTLTRLDKTPAPPGSAMHECGTARMGSDPSNSVLDPYNQCWEARGLYVTDGACFPSQGAQNPTLTIMALTARACEHALRMVSGQTEPRE